MEFFFGDELLDMLTLHFLDAFLQLDLERLISSCTCFHVIERMCASKWISGKLPWKILFTGKIS
jgi:hypothetical protein